MKNRIALLLLIIVNCQAADAIYPRTPDSPTADTIVIKGATPGALGSGEVRIGNGIVSANTVRTGSSVVVGTDPGGSEALRVNGGVRTSGNILIAKTNPVLLLDNNNAAATDASLFFSYVSLQRAGVEKGWLGFGTGTNGLMSVSNTIGDLELNAPSGLVRVPGGRFGIGANGRIQVADETSTATDARWLFRNGTDAHVAMRVIANNTTELSIDAVQASNSGVVKNLVLNINGGNVGIGMSNPTNKLSVNGTISAKEIKVTTTGADYVFEDGYHLRPLSEVAAFIQQHRHLPDIASAKEMQDHGMPVSEVVTSQLAKIEELTLHAIAAERKQVALEQENARLASRLEAIERMLAARLPTTPAP